MLRDVALTGMEHKDGRLQLRLEPLEQRLLLDGNVLVTVSGNDVFITGDDLGNAISITQDPSFLIISGSATTLNGGAGPINIARPIRNITIVMNDGYDSVSLTGLAIGGNISFAGDGGIDEVYMTSCGVAGNVTLDGGDETDGFLITSCGIGGKLLIDAAEGSGIGGVQVFGTNVAGDLIVKGLDGQLDVLIDPPAAATIGGNLIIDGGIAAVNANLSTLRVGGYVLVTSAGPVQAAVDSLRVRGDVTLRSTADLLGAALSLVGAGGSLDFAGALDTQVVASNVAARGSFNMEAGPAAGLSGLSLVTGRFGGNLNYMGAPGADQVSITDTLLRGSVNVDTDTGSAAMAVSGLGARGNLNVSNGLGGPGSYLFEGVTVLGNASLQTDALPMKTLFDGFYVGRDLLIRTGAAGDQVALENGVVAGRTTIRTDGGNDAVAVNNSLFNGSFLLRTGPGEDKVGIAYSGNPAGPAVQFNSSFGLESLSGDDQVFIGIPGQAGNTAVFNGSFMADGGFGFNTLEFAGDNVLASPPSVSNFFVTVVV
jgi:hypothetical protein